MLFIGLRVDEAAPAAAIFFFFFKKRGDSCDPFCSRFFHEKKNR